MTEYSLALAPLGKTFLVRLDTSQVITLGETQRAKRKVHLKDMPNEANELPTGSDDPRITFIDQVLQPGDRIWALLGGSSNSGFLQRAFIKGVEVNRVPYVKLDDGLTVTSDEEDEDTEEEESAIISGWEARRRASAFAIAALAQGNPGAFYPMRATDAQVAQISVVVRAFSFWQRDLRMKAQAQVKSINRDFAYLADDSLSRRQLDLKRQFASPDLLRETVGVESDLLKLLTTELRGMELYQTIFEPIRGCGPSISGQIIDVVQDVRRFPSRAKFRKYSGWFPNGAEGQIVHRQRGQTMGISTRAKQAFNLFGDQVAQWGSGPEWIRNAFTETKEAEITKGTSKLQAHRRAKRKAIGRFVDYVFFRWWLFEITGGTMTQLQMPQEEIPASVRKDLAIRFPELGISPA